MPPVTNPQMGGVFDASKDTVITGQFQSGAAIRSTGTGVNSGIGYATGAGAAVTQLTNRTTSVTLNAPCGAITTNNASLAVETSAAFTVNCSACEISDVPVVVQRSGSNGGNTDVIVTAVAAGSFQISVVNNNAAGGTAETGAIVINYALIKGVVA